MYDLCIFFYPIDDIGGHDNGPVLFPGYQQSDCWIGRRKQSFEVIQTSR